MTRGVEVRGKGGAHVCSHYLDFYSSSIDVDVVGFDVDVSDANGSNGKTQITLNIFYKGHCNFLPRHCPLFFSKFCPGMSLICPLFFQKF